MRNKSVKSTNPFNRTLTRTFLHSALDCKTLTLLKMSPLIVTYLIDFVLVHGLKLVESIGKTFHVFLHFSKVFCVLICHGFFKLSFANQTLSFCFFVRSCLSHCVSDFFSGRLHYFCHLGGLTALDLR